MRLFYDEFGPTPLGVLSFIAALFVGLLVFAVWLDATACRQQGQMAGRETAYRFPAGCFVKNDGQFIPADEFKARAITNERGRE